jgi:hypothetical protein
MYGTCMMMLMSRGFNTCRSSYYLFLLLANVYLATVVKLTGALLLPNNVNTIE